MGAILLTACCLMVATALAPTSSPVETVSTSLTRVTAILERSPATAPAERRREISAIGGSLFDFDEMSRRALAKHWTDMTVAERAEFGGMFRRMLERLFLRAIDGYAGARMTYVEASRRGDLAVVNSEIRPLRGATVRVSYRLLHRNDRWAVYDLVVDGVSVVANYRSQFDRVIATGSRPALLEAMRLADREMAAIGE